MLIVIYSSRLYPAEQLAYMPFPMKMIQIFFKNWGSLLRHAVLMQTACIIILGGFKNCSCVLTIERDDEEIHIFARFQATAHSMWAINSEYSQGLCEVPNTLFYDRNHLHGWVCYLSASYSALPCNCGKLGKKLRWLLLLIISWIYCTF